MTFLLDTNVISEATRPKPDVAVLAFLHETDEESLYLSVITLGELARGVALAPPGVRQAALQAWLERDLRARFQGRMLDVTANVAQAWGELLARRSQAGATMPAVDGLLAATALAHDKVLVTRNVRDFEGCGLAIFDPWTGRTIGR